MFLSSSSSSSENFLINLSDWNMSVASWRLCLLDLIFCSLASTCMLFLDTMDSFLREFLMLAILSFLYYRLFIVYIKKCLKLIISLSSNHLEPAIQNLQLTVDPHALLLRLGQLRCCRVQSSLLNVDRTSALDPLRRVYCCLRLLRNNNPALRRIHLLSDVL